MGGVACAVVSWAGAHLPLAQHLASVGPRPPHAQHSRHGRACGTPRSHPLARMQGPTRPRPRTTGTHALSSAALGRAQGESARCDAAAHAVAGLGTPRPHIRAFARQGVSTAPLTCAHAGRGHGQHPESQVGHTARVVAGAAVARGVAAQSLRRTKRWTSFGRAHRRAGAGFESGTSACAQLTLGEGAASPLRGRTAPAYLRRRPGRLLLHRAAPLRRQPAAITHGRMDACHSSPSVSQGVATPPPACSHAAQPPHPPPLTGTLCFMTSTPTRTPSTSTLLHPSPDPPPGATSPRPRPAPHLDSRRSSSPPRASPPSAHPPSPPAAPGASSPPATARA
jgi:hypothetical protein